MSAHRNRVWPPRGKPHIRKLKKRGGIWVVRVYNPITKRLQAFYALDFKGACSYARLFQENPK